MSAIMIVWKECIFLLHRGSTTLFGIVELLAITMLYANVSKAIEINIPVTESDKS